MYKEYISGETFRIDKVSPSKYLLYTDDYNRLSSNFHFYNVTFNNDSIVIEETTEHKNFIYNFIDKKKESMDNYLEDIKNSRKLAGNELYQLGMSVSV